jgi:hypothetical protein
MGYQYESQTLDCDAVLSVLIDQLSSSRDKLIFPLVHSASRPSAKNETPMKTSRALSQMASTRALRASTPTDQRRTNSIYNGMTP